MFTPSRDFLALSERLIAQAELDLSRFERLYDEAYERGEETSVYEKVLLKHRAMLRTFFEQRVSILRSCDDLAPARPSTGSCPIDEGARGAT